MTKKRTAILISGRGSNMQSLVKAAEVADFPAKIAVVISNRPDAPGLAWAQSKNLKTALIDHKAFPSRDAFEAQLQTVLEAAEVEIIALAGFMRLMTAAFVERWRDRMINIHPSLLPSFKGLHTHEQAIAAGVRIAGCTVHYVRAEMDAGPIIAQAAVRVAADDTAISLGARVLRAEHVIYPHALRLVASGQAICNSEKVHILEHLNSNDALYSTDVPVTT